MLYANIVPPGIYTEQKPGGVHRSMISYLLFILFLYIW